MLLANKILFTRYFAVTLICLALPYLVLFYVINSLLAIVVTLVVITIDLLCILFEKRKDVASFILINSNCLCLLFFSCHLGKGIGAQYLCFAFVVAAFLRFGIENILYTAASLIICIGVIIVLEIKKYSLFQTLPLQENQINLIHYFTIGTTFLIIIAAIMLLFKFIQENKLTDDRINQQFKASGLTLRETEIVMLIIKGQSNKQIAEKLVLEQSTVKTHLKNIFMKINVQSRNQLVAKILDLH